MSQVYLLAAGRGRRAGGPKALLDCGGRPLLEKQLEFLLARFEPQRIAVSIQADWLARLRRLSERVVWVPVDPDAAPLAALQALLRASRMIKWSFIYHVDQPVWREGLFEALRARAGAAEDAVVPIHAGRRGHPVLLSHGLGPELLGLDSATGRLDAFLRTRRTAELPVEWPCVLENWNAGTSSSP